jgi:hypothetical protein
MGFGDRVAYEEPVFQGRRKLKGGGKIPMSRFSVLLLAAALALMTGPMAFADAPELYISSGTANSGVVGIGGSGGTVFYKNSNLGGWNIQLVFGASNSPSDIPFGIDISTLTAACVGGGACAPLDIWLSDINFTQPSGSFLNTYSLTSVSGSASTTQSAWDDPMNNFFGSTTPPSPNEAPPVNDGANFIGMVGPLTAGGTGGSESGGGPESGTPYSLTLEDIFAGCTGTSCVFYSSDGAITGGVPEPGAVVLFGTVLTFCASKLRRRRAS